MKQTDQSVLFQVVVGVAFAVFADAAVDVFAVRVAGAVAAVVVASVGAVDSTHHRHEDPRRPSPQPSCPDPLRVCPSQ